MTTCDVLEAIPKHWFSWDFLVTSSSRPVAEIGISWWREKGELMVEGLPYQVYRERLMSGAFVLSSNGSVLARAEKPSAFRRSFLLDYMGKCYTLQARSAFGRTFILSEDSTEIGSIHPTGLLTRRARAVLPGHLPLFFKVFLIWLTLVLWKREAESTS
ncbi:MAG: hypothetical protein K6T30_08765 [Alicyclobacillus sp.]|nr:hypothetical protein [Alicyclobacillus sp.]